MALRKLDEMPDRAPNAMPVAREHAEFGKRILMVLVAVVLVYLTLYLGTLMRNNIKKYNYIGQADAMERTIAVNGVGKVSAKNDIAMTTIGFSAVDKDVAKAQAANSKVMDPLLKDLKAMGINEKDLQSSYSINPEYNYTPEKGQQLTGFRVSNSVTVKIRDLTKVTEVLSLPSKHGANEVNGLSFTIDNPEDLRDQARAKALVEAKEKAAMLAKSLGVYLGEIVSYGDYDSPTDYYAPMYASRDMLMSEKAAVGPGEIATGGKDISVSVTLVFKMYPKNR